MDTSILVCGATGRVGSEIGRLLGQANVSWRGMTRNSLPDSTANADWVQADLRKPSTLDKCLDGIKTVFLASSDDPNQAELELSMLRACEKADVKHIVKLSAQSAGLNPPVSFGRVHREVEKAIEASNLNWTVLRPNFFMQSLIYFAKDIKQGRLIAPLGSGRVNMVDARDVAAVAAEVLMNPGIHAGRHYLISGPAPKGFEQVANELSKLRASQVRYRSPPIWVARLLLPLIGDMPRWQALQAVDLMKALASNAQSETSQTVHKITGSAPRSLTNFLNENAEAFGGHASLATLPANNS